MFNVCSRCGEYRPDKIIDPHGPLAVCPHCGYAQPFLQLPLLVISGASGAGKSTICLQLLGRVRRAVLLDADILWQPEFNQPEDDYRRFFETWLRLCKNIAQSGRPVVLFNAGAGVSANLEACQERRYFSQIHYLALVCDDQQLAQRLQARPSWRASGSPQAVADSQAFNRWFQESASRGSPAVELLDTSGRSIEDTAAQVERWIDEKLIVGQP